MLRKGFLGTLGLLFMCLPLLTTAQQVQRCHSEEYWEMMQEDDPSMEGRIQAYERAYQMFLANGGTNTSTQRVSDCNVLTVPVVVHVIYDDATSNISDAQVISQIDILNEDYRRIPGSPGFSEGVDTKIQFCLATLDPNGNASTGITRTESSLTNHSQGQSSSLKSLIRWNTSRYLNMWVVKDIDGGILGYATLPGGSPNLDGVVVAGKYFGNTGTAQAPFNRGRTTTHEVGHYLGLRHPFDGGCSGLTPSNCASQGDRICDTPPQSEPHYGCPSRINTCDETPKNLPDPIRNYMGYVDDACMDEFTAGQRDRMVFTLQGNRANLVSNSNLTATGCDGMAIIQSKPEARFTSDVTSGCAFAEFTFEDLSEGCVTSRSWLFPGGNPATSTSQTPTVIYAAPGSYPVQLIVANGQESDTTFEVGYVQIMNSGSTQGLFTESFESANFIPAEWKIENPDGQIGWELYTTAGSEGDYSAVLRNYDYHSMCSEDNLITGLIDIGSLSESAELRFDFAYKLRGTNSQYHDDFRVMLSTDCGEQYAFTIYSLTDSLGGIGTQSSSFSPSAGDWQTVALDLTPYLPFGTIRLQFQAVGMGGQNLYLDNVRIESIPLSVEDQIEEVRSLDIMPNPFASSFDFAIDLDKASDVSVEVLDFQGRTVFASTLGHDWIGQHSTRMNQPEIMALPSGIYFVRVRTDFGLLSKKVIKQ